MRIRKEQLNVIFGITAAALLFYLFSKLQVQNTIMDEGFHLRQIQRFVTGDFMPDKSLAMGPGYHLLIQLPARLFGSSLQTVRILNLILNLFVLGLFYFIARKFDRSNAL